MCISVIRSSLYIYYCSYLWLSVLRGGQTVKLALTNQLNIFGQKDENAMAKKTKIAHLFSYLHCDYSMWKSPLVLPALLICLVLRSHIFSSTNANEYFRFVVCADKATHWSSHRRQRQQSMRNYDQRCHAGVTSRWFHLLQCFVCAICSVFFSVALPLSLLCIRNHIRKYGVFIAGTFLLSFHIHNGTVCKMLYIVGFWFFSCSLKIF